jgi:hypothetical protein
MGRRVDDLNRVIVGSADIENLPSLETVMPRGRWPTLMVLITSMLSLSRTLTELPFSFET